MAKLKSKRTHSAKKESVKGSAQSPAEWACALVELEDPETDDENGVIPSDALLWLGKGGHLLGVQLGSVEELETQVLESFRETVAAPMHGAPRRPSTVRIADPGFARKVEAALGGAVKVICAATPEVGLAKAALQSFFATRGGGEKQSYFSRGVTAAAVAAFFRAAARLYRAAPWKSVPSDTDLLSLSVPDLDIEGAVVCVIGQMGESVGVVVFESLDDFEAYVDVVEAFEQGEDLAMPPHLALNFDKRGDISPDLRAEIQKHAWEVAGPSAYPSVVAVEEQLLGRAPTEEELLLAETLALALAELIETTPQFQNAWKTGKALTTTKKIRTHSGLLDVTLALPYVHPPSTPADAPPDRRLSSPPRGTKGRRRSPASGRN